MVKARDEERGSEKRDEGRRKKEINEYIALILDMSRRCRRGSTIAQQTHTRPILLPMQMPPKDTRTGEERDREKGREPFCSVD